MDSRLVSLAAVTSSFSLLWPVSVVLQNASIVDTFWSLGFLTQVAIYHYHKDSEEGFFPRKLLVLNLNALWAIRLSLYLAWRNHGLGEDWRYVQIRRGIGPKFWLLSLVYIFLFQSVLNYIIGVPLYYSQTAKSSWTVTDLIGLIVFCFGFIFETVADFQLASFKANPDNKGKLLRSGLWALSRHPNYFGESAVWWGLYLLSCADGAWYSGFSPAIMTYLLLKVSGVPFLEKSFKKTKPNFENYVKTTNAFVPWFPSH